MSFPLDPAELHRRTVELHARDEALGRKVEARVTGIYGASGSVEHYRFDDSFDRDEQATHKIDWVHQDNLRAVRFLYRHLPRPVRFIIKKFVP